MTEQFILQSNKGGFYDDESKTFNVAKDKATKFNSYSDASKKRKKMLKSFIGNIYIISIK